MNKTKTKNTTAIVYNKNGEIVGYLTERHEEQGIDIQLDLQGHTIIAI